MARTVALIAERLPIPGLAPLVIEYVWTPEPRDVSSQFRAAARDGYYEICEDLMGNRYVSANRGLQVASMYGHLGIVILMANNGADDWNEGLRAACGGGHMDIVLFAISKGAKDWDAGLRAARCGSHVDVARLMTERGGRWLVWS